MEKQGVCSGETCEPEKQAGDAPSDNPKKDCCGTDTASKMAEAANDASCQKTAIAPDA